MWRGESLDRDYIGLIESHGLKTAFSEFLGDVGTKELSEIYLGFINGKDIVLVEPLKQNASQTEKDILKRAFKSRNALIQLWQQSRHEISYTADLVLAIERDGKIERFFIVPPSPN